MSDRLLADAMPDLRREAPVDYVALGESLATLGYPVRLALLDKLRFPHQLKDIRLPPHRVRRDANPERPVARQTLQTHLKLLRKEGLIHHEVIDDGGKGTGLYVANPSRLYAIAEELRRLSLRYSGTGQDPQQTGTVAAGSGPSVTTGPRLVLVHGVYEGRAFPLTAATSKDGTWTIGRRKDASIPLDYDPFVSTRNTRIEPAGTGFMLRDLPESKNGTSVNWQPLPRGGTHALRPGDVVGVGRSLLVFVPA